MGVPTPQCLKTQPSMLLYFSDTHLSRFSPDSARIFANSARALRVAHQPYRRTVTGGALLLLTQATLM